MKISFVKAIDNFSVQKNHFLPKTYIYEKDLQPK